MKIIYRISLIMNICFMAALLIKGGMLLGQRYLQQDLSVENSSKGSAENAIDQSKVINLESEYEDAAEVSDFDTLTTCDTTYQILSYDKTTGIQEKNEERIPAGFIAKNRKQIEAFLSDYEDNVSLEDKEKGFVSVQLQSFSPSMLVVQKIYQSDSHYCLIVEEDGYLTVYDGQKDQVILYTDIMAKRLPVLVRQEIEGGKYLDTEDQLYQFLESYSS